MGSTSQTGPSQTIDLTQYQQDYQVYEQAQDQAYHFEEPQPHQYQFDAYQQHQYEIIKNSLILSRSSLILRSLNNMMVGIVFKGCRGWCTRPDQTAMQGAFCAHILVDMLHAGFGSMPM